MKFLAEPLQEMIKLSGKFLVKLDGILVELKEIKRLLEEQQKQK